MFDTPPPENIIESSGGLAGVTSVVMADNDEKRSAEDEC